MGININNKTEAIAQFDAEIGPVLRDARERKEEQSDEVTETIFQIRQSLANLSANAMVNYLTQEPESPLERVYIMIDEGEFDDQAKEDIDKMVKRFILKILDTTNPKKSPKKKKKRSSKKPAENKEIDPEKLESYKHAIALIVQSFNESSGKSIRFNETMYKKSANLPGDLKDILRIMPFIMQAIKEETEEKNPQARAEELMGDLNEKRHAIQALSETFNHMTYTSAQSLYAWAKDSWQEDKQQDSRLIEIAKQMPDTKVPGTEKTLGEALGLETSKA